MPRKEELHLSPRSLTLSIDTSVSMITTSSAGDDGGSPTTTKSTRTTTAQDQSAIDEITNILTKRAAEISSIVQKNMSLDWFGQQQQQQRQVEEGIQDTTKTATLLAAAASLNLQEEDQRFATFINQALEESDRLKKEVRELNSTKEFTTAIQHHHDHQDSLENYGLKKIVRELKMTQLALKDQELKTAMQLADMAKMKDMGKSQRDAVKSAKETIQAKDKIIECIKKENEEMADKAQELNKRVTTLTEEIARYENFILDSKSLAENQSSLIQENEKTIRDLEAKNADLWSKWRNDANTLKCKEALLNMQRQRMEEQENLLKIYEAKFLTKGVDVAKVMARAEEGERLWSKIKEREKRFNERKIIVATLREENANLKFDKKRLQSEVDQLKNCLETFNLKLSDTGDKVHMPWLLSHLRDNVSLQDRVNELEEIVRGAGYTVKAAEAEKDFRRKEIELATEIERISGVIGMLKDQTHDDEGDVQKFEVSVLLGKLEEALLIYGYDGYENKAPKNDEIVSAASSDVTSMMSHESFVKREIVTAMSNESWNNQGCTVMSSFTEGCSTLQRRGLFSGRNDAEEERKEANNNMGSVYNNEDREAGKQKYDDEASDDDYDVDGRNDTMSISQGISSYSSQSTDNGNLSEAPSTVIISPKSNRVLGIRAKGGDDHQHWRMPLSPFSHASNNIVRAE